jgi:transposase
VVVIGVDAHKRTHTASAVHEATGRAQGDVTVSADGDGHLRLLDFARGHGEQRIWAVEDCRHVSGALERFLLGAGETVIRVPPNMMSGARKTERTRGKSDPIDATAVARAAIRQPDLPRAFLAGPEREIALLVGHRAHLVHERTRLSKRLRWLLHDLDPALEPADRMLSQLATIKRVDRRLARLKPSIAVRICREHLARLRDLTRRIDALKRELTPMVRRHAPQLLLMPGCGTIVAARIIAEVANINRFQTDAQLALYAGIAPLDASSGKQKRHRLNRTGNRQLNHAIHIIAVTQARIHAPAREYLARRKANGKTNKEALRALKRLLIRRVFTLMRTTPGRGPIAVSSAPFAPCLT